MNSNPTAQLMADSDSHLLVIILSKYYTHTELLDIIGYLANIAKTRAATQERDPHAS